MWEQFTGGALLFTCLIVVKLQFRMILTSMSLSDEHNCSNTNILTKGGLQFFKVQESTEPLPGKYFRCSPSEQILRRQRWWWRWQDDHTWRQPLMRPLCHDTTSTTAKSQRQPKKSNEHRSFLSSCVFQRTRCPSLVFWGIVYDLILSEMSQNVKLGVNESSPTNNVVSLN